MGEIVAKRAAIISLENISKRAGGQTHRHTAHASHVICHFTAAIRYIRVPPFSADETLSFAVAGAYAAGDGAVKDLDDLEALSNAAAAAAAAAGDGGDEDAGDTISPVAA